MRTPQRDGVEPPQPERSSHQEPSKAAPVYVRSMIPSPAKRSCCMGECDLTDCTDVARQPKRDDPTCLRDFFRARGGDHP